MNRSTAAIAVTLSLLVSTTVVGSADAHKKRRGRGYEIHHASVWQDLDHCESTHGKHPNRFQFTLRTWRSMPERAGRPETHTYAEQLLSAQQLVQRSGWGQFPACSRLINAYRRSR